MTLPKLKGDEINNSDGSIQAVRSKHSSKDLPNNVQVKMDPQLNSNRGHLKSTSMLLKPPIKQERKQDYQTVHKPRVILPTHGIKIIKEEIVDQSP